MPTYTVRMVRDVAVFGDVTVEANSAKEAKRIAKEQVEDDRASVDWGDAEFDTDDRVRALEAAESEEEEEEEEEEEDGDPVSGSSAPPLEGVVDSPEVAVVRAKLEKIASKCDPNCRGWFISDASDGPRIERCDECADGSPDPIYDVEAERLPEAQALLAEIVTAEARVAE